MEKHYPTLREFLSFRTLVEEFFEGNFSPWAYRMLLESIKDKSFISEISPVLKRAHNDLDYKEMNELIQWARDKCSFYLERAKEEKNLDKQFNISTRMMTFFGLTECLHEHGSFSEKVFKELQQEFGRGYISELEKVDRKYLSLDVRNFLNVNENTEDWPKNEALRKYLVLKNWQDNQHRYYLDQVENFIWPLEDAYIKSKGHADFYPPNLRHVNNINALKVQALTELSQQPFTNIDMLAEYYLSGIDKEISKLFGGKTYGLVVLKASGANIPLTYAIPVTQPEPAESTLEKMKRNASFAVRSSADIEDGSDFSFAGMFDSVLNVKSQDLLKSIRTVKHSVDNPRVKSYVKVNHLEKPQMAVIIQEFREPDFSGVWIGSAKNAGVLEWVKGNGEKLVSGKVNPNREMWSNGRSTDQSVIVGEKFLGEALIELQQKVSKTGTADFEWCVLDDKLVMLQYRPVTKSIDFIQEVIKQGILETGEFQGLPVSSGKIEGPAKFVRKINELEKWNDGDILMAWFTDPEWMEILHKSSGIVTAVGGFLCHSAIIARELGIPCVVGIGGDSMKKIWDRTYLSIDGDKGTVSVNYPDNEKKNLSIKNIRRIKDGKERS